MKQYAFFASALVCAALMAVPLSAELMKEPEGYIDEGKMPIMEDTPTVENPPIVDPKTDMEVRREAPSISGTLIKKYFKDRDTFVIICKGYPKPGALGREAVGTAREAALLNAQTLAAGAFEPPVDVIKSGSVERYIDGKGYALIYYIVRHPNLKRLLK
ncbi:MAG TPA: hypothetical protein PK875_07790 [Spirochaetota bacterium]|nr:hypothetical protein [Spirochaetota bacterium]